MSLRTPGGKLEDLFAELLQAGENAGRIRTFLMTSGLDTEMLLGLLRRAVPVRLLHVVGTEPPWSDDIRLRGRVVLNSKTPVSLSQRLLPRLAWGDLAEVARSPRVPGAVRVRAEGILREVLPEMRLGDRIAFAKIATPSVLSLLIKDPEPRVAEACLLNPRLREEDLVSALGQDDVSRVLIEAVHSGRWRECYRVRLALVLQPRTPLPIALAHVSSLVTRDLRRVATATSLVPLVQLAARRVAEESTRRAGSGTPEL